MKKMHMHLVLACKNDVGIYITYIIWDMKNVLKSRKNVPAYLPDVATASDNFLSLHNLSKLRSPKGTSISRYFK